MKKALLRIGVGMVVLLVLAVLCVSLFLDGSVKRGIEIVGSRLTGVEVKLDTVSLSPVSGTGKIKELVVGNPQPYKTPRAIRVQHASLALVPASLLSDKIVIESIRIESPEITLEGGFSGNNLSKILANVRGSTASETNAPAGTPAAEKPGRKFEVDDLRIIGAKVNVSVTGMGGRFIPISVGEIHLSSLGKSSEGISSAELVRVVLEQIEKAAIQAGDKALTELGKNAGGWREGLDNEATGTVQRLQKGLGDFLKKK